MAAKLVGDKLTTALPSAGHNRPHRQGETKEIHLNHCHVGCLCVQVANSVPEITHVLRRLHGQLGSILRAHVDQKVGLGGLVKSRPLDRTDRCRVVLGEIHPHASHDRRQSLLLFGDFRSVVCVVAENEWNLGHVAHLGLALRGQPKLRPQLAERRGVVETVHIGRHPRRLLSLGQRLSGAPEPIVRDHLGGNVSGALEQWGIVPFPDSGPIVRPKDHRLRCLQLETTHSGEILDVHESGAFVAVRTRQQGNLLLIASLEDAGNLVWKYVSVDDRSPGQHCVQPVGPVALHNHPHLILSLRGRTVNGGSILLAQAIHECRSLELLAVGDVLQKVSAIQPSLLRRAVPVSRQIRLHDSALEQACCLVGRHVDTDAHSASRLSPQRHPRWVSAKSLGISLHPAHGLLLVHNSEVALHPGARISRQCQEPVHLQPVVHSNDHHVVLLGQIGPVVQPERPLVGPLLERAPVVPDQDRQVACALRGENVHVKAILRLILRDIRVVARVALLAPWPVLGCIPGLRPLSRGLRRSESLASGKRNTEELPNTIRRKTAHWAGIGVHHQGVRSQGTDKRTKDRAHGRSRGS
mmetsp:Transcript_56659/g.124241  ORF Transcript_56659/g.124241 Transcript_56659/m.124241 type:complete len:582 (+) Transcript_56659:69-1814(+)